MLCMGAVSIMFYVDTGLYNVLNYRLGHHLPLASTVLVLYHMSESVLGLLPLIILLFPAGRLPSPRWRLAMGGYLTLALADMAVQAQMSVYALPTTALRWTPAANTSRSPGRCIPCRGGTSGRG